MEDEDFYDDNIEASNRNRRNGSNGRNSARYKRSNLVLRGGQRSRRSQYCGRGQRSAKDQYSMEDQYSGEDQHSEEDQYNQKVQYKGRGQRSARGQRSGRGQRNGRGQRSARWQRSGRGQRSARDQRSGRDQYQSDVSYELNFQSHRAVNSNRRGNRRSNRSRGGKTRQTGREYKRKNPTGVKEMEKWLENPPDMIVSDINSERSGFKLLIEEGNLNSNKMNLLMKILGKASTSQTAKQGLNEIYSTMFTDNFVEELIYHNESLSSSEATVIEDFLVNQLTLLNAYSKAMPMHAIDHILQILNPFTMTISNSKMTQDTDLQSLEEGYDKLKEYCNMFKRKEEPKQSKRPRHYDDLASFDDYEHSESFRDLSVVPTIEDIENEGRPLIKKNLVDRGYKDVETYLDVHFRLLREDFIGPLREGIQKYHADNKSKVNDIRIYKNVQVSGSDIIKGRLVHFMKLPFMKKINIESSKRLLFGNVLCLTHDNFQTFFVCTISERDENKLKKGLIGISPVDVDCAIDYSKTYIIAESRTFFTAYKPVLEALQNIDESNFPLADQIVYVDDDVLQPRYLMQHNYQYDLRVVKDTQLMKDDNDRTKLLLFGKVSTTPPTGHSSLSSIRINTPLQFWPPKKKFEFDASQMKAFHSALTKRFAIIQGPPGTGKTYLGLKITQALLHNSSHWSHKSDDEETDEEEAYEERTNGTDSIPILVLCYTNHALDQFLEGMQKFTNRIVRIGGRSKNEEIQKFQINNFVSTLLKSRKMPSIIRHRNYEIRGEIGQVEQLYQTAKKDITLLLSTKGILKLSFLKSFGIIPDYISNQFANDSSFMKWIVESSSPIVDLTIQNNSVEDNATGESNEQFFDAMQLQREEEANRIIDDDGEDYEPLIYKPREETQKRLSQNDYIITNLMLECTKNDLIYRNSLISTDPDIEYPHSTLAHEITTIERKLQVLHLAVDRFQNGPRMRKMRGNENVFSLSFDDRCMLYGTWRESLRMILASRLQPIEERYKKLYAMQDEIRMTRHLYIARQADVVGMTTTGAAQNCSMIQDLKPKIVIIEEAAEILEAHIVTSLPSSCEHLIMIGDHQQLKPSTAVYDLAKQFNLEVSLFERMIKNNLSFETLEFQHRMRPEISDLLVPTIYPNLKDHNSVSGRSNILGMTKNVFFLKHDKYELKKSDDNNSHSNEFEADLIVRLARHLVLQGYSTDQITILTPYSGQFFLLRKKIRNHNVCNGLRISVVDNFQGEENDIILLSLVRSNSRCNVGFLKVENRVCVALSRAKFGMYIVGNMNQLCSANPDLWPKINSSLEEQFAVGKTMTLKCQNHPSEISDITSGEDIRRKSPEGGCRKLCNTRMSKCSHVCSKVCHIQDMNHELFKCYEDCEKKCTKRNHDCPAKCYQECPPCVVNVERELPCGHMHSFACHISKSEFKCQKPVEKRIEPCGHSVVIACHKTPRTCPVKCDVRLDCGHACRFTCHVENDPKHLKYICYEKCASKKKNCSRDHKCTLPCYENCEECTVVFLKQAPCGHKVRVKCDTDMETYVCKQKCKRMIPGCGHYCKRKCFEPCGGCQEMVTKVIPACGHQTKVKCSSIPSKTDCRSNNCPLILPCGHKCDKKCKESCSETCKSPVRTEFTCPKKHPINIPCYLSSSIAKSEDAWKYCGSNCGSKLDCDHFCLGKCGECLHGRLHVLCKEKCERTLVCGHLCKSPCSAACPPCQAKCQWRCKHSKCNKTCGIMCTPCNELCEPSCEHKEPCGKKCGEICDCEPCDEPCPEKLPCGHDCIGFCSDPCPELCRICHLDQLTEVPLLMNEEDPDARFVKLLDCGHIIEVEGLTYWLQKGEDNTIQMKKCPRGCGQAIYNSPRFKNIVLKAYKDVQKVLFTKQDGVPSFKEIAERLTESTTVKEMKQRLALNGTKEEYAVQNIRIDIRSDFSNFSGRFKKSLLFEQLCEYLTSISSSSEFSSMNGRRVPEPKISQEKLYLFDFQARILEKAVTMKENLDSKTLQKELTNLVNRVLELKIRISPQLVTEVDCELNRIEIRKSTRKVANARNLNLHILHYDKKIKELMNPAEKFTVKTAQKVKAYLKLCESHLGSLGISDEEKKQILSAMSGSVRQGAWYKCPNGHIYCISDCGGAMEEGVCPECKCVIGGGSHALRGDNTLATEMDGATRAAWPQERF